tara:strand:- start:353 stop:868 length:516 start_codon:yes stop_codon:yes gene_type:complete
VEKNLTLTGMMGVGKTTIGKRLAKKLKYNFIDIDKIIEKKEGRSINSIFKNHGEDYFRKIEKDVTLAQLQKINSVISLGGGAFLNNSIRKYTKQYSISFWLDVPLEKLAIRLKRSKKRPLLNKENTTESLKKIYFVRKKFYNKADYKINCKRLTLKKILQRILNLYELSRN